MSAKLGKLTLLEDERWPPVDQQAGPGAPHPAPVLRMYVLTTVSTVGAIFKDTALSKHFVVESFWMTYMTNPRQSLYINF